MSEQAHGGEPPFDPVSVARALETMRQLPLQLAEQRIGEVGGKCEEVLRGLIAAVKDARPAWELELKDSWWDSQLDAITRRLAKEGSSLPDELAIQLGSQIVADVHDALLATIERASAGVVSRCASILETEFAEVVAYRASLPARKAHEQLEEQEERIDELEARATAASASSGVASLIALAALILAAVAWLGR